MNVFFKMAPLCSTHSTLYHYLDLTPFTIGVSEWLVFITKPLVNSPETLPLNYVESYHINGKLFHLSWKNSTLDFNLNAFWLQS